MVEIQNIAARLDDLNIDATEKLWAQYTTGLDFGVDEAQKKVRAFLQDKDNFKTICKSSETENTLLDRRRIEILMKQFRPYHHSAHANTIKSEIDAFETKLGEVLNKHRTIVDGQERSSAEVSRILGESDDREMRKRTYLAQASINEELVDNGFLELIQLRQAYAQEIGYHNFIELRADQDDLGPNFFDGWLDQTAQYQRSYHELSGKVAKRFLGHEDLQPWDLRYLQNLLSERNRHIVDLSSFQTILAKVFRQFGFEIDRLPITYDIFPRRNKSEWGYMFPIRIGKDIRIIANMDNRFSSYWVLMHETAHAAHYFGLNPDEILLNLGVSSIVSEGFANFFGDLCFSKEFLAQFFPNEVDKAFEDFRIVKSFLEMNQVSFLGKTFFDQGLYLNKLQHLDDVNELFWRVHEKSLGFHRHEGEPPWGKTIHHTTAPIYLHNYFVGDVLCEALKDRFLSLTGTAWHEQPLRFGKFWKDEVLDPSGTFPVVELFHRATGQSPQTHLKTYLESIFVNARRNFG